MAKAGLFDGTAANRGGAPAYLTIVSIFPKVHRPAQSHRRWPQSCKMHSIRRVIILALLCFLTKHGLSQEVDFNRDRDSIYDISKNGFDSLLVQTTAWLKRKKDLSAIPPGIHVAIIRLQNTISIAMSSGSDTAYDKRKVATFLDWYEKRAYGTRITEVYPDFKVSRGLGYYFPKLGVELHGTPFRRSRFRVAP